MPAPPQIVARLLLVVSCCLVVAAMPAATRAHHPHSGPARSDTLGVDAWRMLAASSATGFALVPRVDRLSPPSAVGYQPSVAVVAAALAVAVPVPLISRTQRRSRPSSSTRDPPLLG